MRAIRRNYGNTLDEACAYTDAGVCRNSVLLLLMTLIQNGPRAIPTTTQLSNEINITLDARASSTD